MAIYQLGLVSGDKIPFILPHKPTVYPQFPCVDRRRREGGLPVGRPGSQRRRARRPFALRAQRRAAARQAALQPAEPLPDPHGARRRARAGGGHQLLAGPAAVPAAVYLVDHPHRPAGGRPQAQAEHRAAGPPLRSRPPARQFAAVICRGARKPDCRCQSTVGDS